MDIRNWFTSSKAPASVSSKAEKEKKLKSTSEAKKKKSPKKASTASRKRRVIESDSDEDPLPTKRKHSKNKSHSDDDIDIIDSSPEEIRHKNKNFPKKVQQKQVVPVVKEKKSVSVSDFFGSGFIQRKEKKEAPKSEPVPEDNHEDDDFVLTLEKLDKNQNDEKVQLNTSEKKSTSKHEEKKISRKNGNEISSSLEAKKRSSKTENEISSSPEVKKHSSKSDAKSSRAFEKRQQLTNGKKPGSKRKTSKSDSIVKLEITPSSDKVSTAKVIEKTPPAKRKSGGNSNYFSYLGREGPRALGSKEIPEGEEDCLKNMTFIITGVLESMERDEAKELIEKYSGKLMTTLTKNTNYVIIGRDAGHSKLEKAVKFGTKQLDEDGLLELIKTMPGKKGGAKKLQEKKQNVSSPKKQDDSPQKRLDICSPEKKNDSPQKKLDICSPNKKSDSPEKKKEAYSPKKQGHSPVKKQKTMPSDDVESDISVANLPQNDFVSSKADHLTLKADENKQSNFSQQNPSISPIEKQNVVTSMWVDKYKPFSLKQIIGQQGEKSNAAKLLKWLLNWSKNRKLNKKPIPAGRWNSSDDGSGFKAALLSGPPGVGKTTTAQLVCKEAKFDFFELNASDTRSKKSLQHIISQLLGNQTLSDCFKAGNSGTVSQNHVIIMDEVDGMAGNEDRGGMQELISFIKASKVPIICICNDRNHTKIRSLANYCFDLRFQKPRVEQIKAAMLSVAFKEGVKISPNALQDVIVSSNQDIRQVLHNLSVWSAKERNLSAEQIKSDIGQGTKHIKLGPFDVLREVFAIGNNPNATIMDKSNLFFHDYSIAPLFVQENYVHVMPSSAEGDKNKHLCLLSETADSICIGDLIDRQIRTQNSWSLLPTQSIFASVVPGELMKGHLRQMINFPAWLGKNSNRNHMDRILQELHMHMRMRVSGNKTDVTMEYLPLLKHALTKPLIEKESEGVRDALKTMEEYYLLREDFDSIIELSLWSGQTDPRTKINTKTKSAFTRMYNKECGTNPYAVSNVKKKKKLSKESESDMLDEENEVLSDEEEDDSLENDGMVKVKKATKRSTDTDPKVKAKASGSKQSKKPRLK